MRRIAVALAAFAGLSGCMSLSGDYPTLRYATAAESGVVAMQLAGRPSNEDLLEAEGRWSRAITDAHACGIDTASVSEAALVGAMELAVMSSASRGRQEPFEGVIGYMASLGRERAAGVRQPGADRCDRLSEWVGSVRYEGRDLLLREARDRLLPPG
jgi:hypothetical protein